jgi:hypothetical protein
MRLSLNIIFITIFIVIFVFGVIISIYLYVNSTVVYVLDSDRLPIISAKITCQQYSVGGWYDCGKTNLDGSCRIWLKIPGIESITVSKAGYETGTFPAKNGEIVNVTLLSKKTK